MEARDNEVAASFKACLYRRSFETISLFIFYAKQQHYSNGVFTDVFRNCLLTKVLRAKYKASNHQNASATLPNLLCQVQRRHGNP